MIGGGAGKFMSLSSLVMQWRFTRGVEAQTKAFMDGFNEVVPIEWIQIFDEKELEVVNVLLSVFVIWVRLTSKVPYRP